MTTKLEWWPKQFGPGDIDGDGALKLLGTPNLHPVSILVRETAQNSWDAGVDDQIRFFIHGRTLKGKQLRNLRENVFSNPGKGMNLKDVLKRDQVQVLEISDRGTSGLGGPLRNDRVHDSETTDYIDFVLNIGAKRDKKFGGGTYGFGKTISYIASSAHTMLIWSRSIEEGKVESRLIGSAFGDRFEQRQKRYTGRQWWGRRVDSGNMVEPLIGREAEALAKSVFASRFDDRETGTSLMIIDPAILGLSLEELISACGEAIMWHLWPKLIVPPGSKKRRPMDLKLILEGENVALPDPRKHPVLKNYVASLQAVRAAQKSDADPDSPFTSVESITRGAPNKTLGHLAITRAPAEPADETASDSEIPPIASPAHSVALMRNRAELVVTYLDLPEPPASGVEFAGVFRCHEGVDDYFASAEPPAHDGWEPGGMLDKRAKSDVTVALRRIRDRWKETVLPGTGASRQPGSGGSEGFLSAQLGDLVPTLDGTRAGTSVRSTTTAPRTRGNGSARPKLHIVGNGAHAMRGSTALAMVAFRVEGPAEDHVVECDAGVGYEGGTDMGSDQVKVEGFVPELLNGDRVVMPPRRGRRLVIEPNGSREWTVIVSHEQGLAVDIDLRIRRVEPE